MSVPSESDVGFPVKGLVSCMLFGLCGILHGCWGVRLMLLDLFHLLVAPFKSLLDYTPRLRRSLHAGLDILSFGAQ